MTVRVRVLGGFEIETIPAGRLGSRKARTLLKMLALARGRPVSVDALIDGLWEEGLPARPADQVAVLVSRLRGVLGAGRITRTEAGYILHADWLDLDELERLVEEAERRLAAGAYATAKAASAAALALARGPVLPEEPDAAWAEADRGAAERLTGRARRAGAAAALAAGDLAMAVGWAESGIAADPYDEAILRMLMAAHAAAGRPAAGLEAYERIRVLLAEELGADPAPESRELHAAILQQRPVPEVTGGVVPGLQPAGRSAELPGRAGELEALDEALANSSSGARIVVVEGEAGIGKTRLLETWASRAGGAGAVILRARCTELGRALPLQEILDALEGHLRGLDGPSRAMVLEGYEAVLGPVLGLSPPGERPSGPDLVDAQTGRALLFAALLTVIERLAGTGRVVLLLDDAHHAGQATVEWLHYASRRAGPPFLAVVTKWIGAEASFAASVTLQLGPLDVEAAAEIVGPERAQRLHQRSGGNPLFLVELAAAGDEDELPGSIRDAVRRRCDQLGHAGATLRAAAVVGPVVDLDLLSGVLGRAPVELLEHLEEGVRRRFLIEHGASFAFQHGLVRDALAAGTTASRRALLHREAARVLVSRPVHDPLEVAHHAEVGGDGALASSALIEAATAAVERFDHAQAERLLDRSLELRGSIEGRLERARVRMALGRHDEAAEDARVAIGLGAGAPGLEVAGWAAYYRRETSVARRLAEDGARLATEPSVRARCLALAGRTTHMDGDLATAESYLEEATRIATGPTAAVASVWLGSLWCHRSRPDEALEVLRTAEAGARIPAFAVAHLHLNTAYAHAQLGRPVEALRSLDRFDEVVARLDVDRFAGRSDNFRGWILRNLGALGRADEHNARSRAEAERLGLPEPHAHALLDLAEGSLQRGELGEASAYLERLEPIQRIDHALAWRHEMRARLTRARILVAAGEPEDAGALALEVGEDAGRLGVRRYAVLARLTGAGARIEAGERVRPGEIAADVDALGEVAGLEAWWVTARIARATGVDAWWDLAARRAARLACEAGPYGDDLRRYAERHLGEGWVAAAD